MKGRLSQMICITTNVASMRPRLWYSSGMSAICPLWTLPTLMLDPSSSDPPFSLQFRPRTRRLWNASECMDPF